MLRPAIAFVIGFLVIAYAMMVYRGSPIARGWPGRRSLYGDSITFASLAAIGLALTLGLVGFFSGLYPEFLQAVRTGLGIGGILGLIRQVIWRVDFRGIGRSAYKYFDVQRRLDDAHHYLELLHVLVGRNLKVRYRGSFLGVYWSLLSPIIMTGLYSAVFGTAFSHYYNNSIPNYMLAAFTGLVVINFFSASTSQALTSIVSHGSLLNKISLPVSVFPVSAVIANLFQLVVGVMPLLVLMTIINSRNIVNILWLPLPFLALVITCAGIALLASSLFVFFRDLPYFYDLLVFVLWVSSPIFYPSAIVPESVRPYLSLNPLSPIIESLRSIVLSNNGLDLHLLGTAFTSGFIFLVLGLVCFRAWQPKFMDLL
jgi:lipopolysaccharide transport system permease protein